MILGFDDVKDRIAEKVLRKSKLNNVPLSFKNQAFEKARQVEKTERRTLNDALYDLRLVLHDFIPITIHEVFDILLDPTTETKDRLRCIEIILNRYDGRPRERLEIASVENTDISAAVALSQLENRYKLLPPGPEKDELKIALKKTEKVMKNGR